MNGTMKVHGLLWILAALLGGASSWAAEPAHTSVGPASQEEAEVLWRESRADLERGLYEDAIPKLERYIARYVGYPDYLEARHQLGRAYLKTRHPEKASKELRFYIQSRGPSRSKTPEALRARLELAQAYLDLERFDEAKLAAEETAKLTDGVKTQADTHAEALILRARAETGLGQDKRATRTLESALKELGELGAEGPARLRGAARGVELELKLRQCGRFPPKGRLAEEQARDQLNRRGRCLLESLLGYRETLRAGDRESTEEATRVLTEAYASYWHHCQHPPTPPPIKPRDRTAKQLKTYFGELVLVLEQDCRAKIKEGRDLLAGWQAEARPAGIATAPYDDALKDSTRALEKYK